MACKVLDDPKAAITTAYEGAADVYNSLPSISEVKDRIVPPPVP